MQLDIDPRTCSRPSREARPDFGPVRFGAPVQGSAETVLHDDAAEQLYDALIAAEPLDALMTSTVADLKASEEITASMASS
jgi:hypothetical protein